MARGGSTYGVRPARFLPTFVIFILCVFIAFIHVNVAGRSLSFLCLPLLCVALWPRGLSAWLTIIMFLAAGLFVDWGTAGAPGQWALVYLTVFALTRPDLRSLPLGFVNALRNWIVAVIVTMIVLSVTGLFVYGVWPSFTAMAWQLGAATMLLPVLYGLRRLFYVLFSQPDEMDF